MTDYFKGIKPDKEAFSIIKSRMAKTRQDFKGTRAVIKAMKKQAKMLWEIKKLDLEKNKKEGKKTAVFCREIELGILVICDEEGLQVEQNVNFNNIPAPWGFGSSDSDNKEN